MQPHLLILVCICVSNLFCRLSCAITEVETDFVIRTVLAVAVMVNSDAADEQKKKVPYALLLIGKEKGKGNDLNGQVSAFDNLIMLLIWLLCLHLLT